MGRKTENYSQDAMKVCSRCKIGKDDSHFRLRRETRGKRGGGKLEYLNNTCKSCDAQISNKYYSHHKDDPEWLDRWRQKSRDYHAKNREGCKEKQRLRRQTPEYQQYMKEYRQKNKGKIKPQAKKRNKIYMKKVRKEVRPIYAKILKRTEEYQLKKNPKRNPTYKNLSDIEVRKRVVVKRIKDAFKRV